MNKVVLNEKELADELGLSAWTVRGMRLKEGCPHFMVGHRVFYRKESVMAWIAAKEAGSIPASEAVEYGKIRPIK